MEFLFYLVYFFQTLNSNYITAFFLGNALIIYNFLFSKTALKINFGTFITPFLFTIPILIYISGINSISLGSDLSTIVSITIFASNLIKDKILEVLKNFEIIMITAVLTAIISIILSRGNSNYVATLLFLPSIVIFLREDYIINKFLKKIFLRYSFLILIINFAVVFLSKSSLIFLFSIIFSVLYLFSRYFSTFKIMNLSKLYLSYVLYLISVLIASTLPLLVYILRASYIFNTGWNLKNDIRFLIDIGIVKDFINNNALVFGNGIFNNPNKGFFSFITENLREVSRDLSAHNFFSELLYRHGYFGIAFFIVLLTLFFTPLDKENRTIENLAKSIFFLSTLISILMIYNIIYTEAWPCVYIILVTSTYFKVNYKLIKH